MLATLPSVFRRPGQACKAFTLVELVLYLAILGLILTTLVFMRIRAVEKVTEVV